jgi:hypothetical protein
MNPKEISFDSVYSVYTGKAGKCCCGCAGKHTYVSTHRDFSTNNRGYKVEDHEICDSAAKRIFNQIVNDPDAKVDDAGFITVESDTRLKIAYFKN